MKQLNLSEWALNHHSFVIYIMLVAVAAGVLSYYRLGRNEDPSFIIKRSSLSEIQLMTGMAYHLRSSDL